MCHSCTGVYLGFSGLALFLEANYVRHPKGVGWYNNYTANSAALFTYRVDVGYKNTGYKNISVIRTQVIRTYRL